MDIGWLQQGLRKRVEETIKDSGLTLNIDHLFGGIPAMETANTTEIIRAAEKFTGHSAESVAFGTEGPFLQQLGMDTVILGPGDIAQAHQPDEYLGLDQLNPTVLLIQNMVKRFCLS